MLESNMDTHCVPWKTLHTSMCVHVSVRERWVERERIRKIDEERMRLLLGPCSFGFVLNFLSLRMGVILLLAGVLLEVPGNG